MGRVRLITPGNSTVQGGQPVQNTGPTTVKAGVFIQWARNVVRKVSVKRDTSNVGVTFTPAP